MDLIFLPETSSTQSFLIDLIQKKALKHPNTLVYTDKQTAGQGRHGRTWQHYPGSLACSFTLTANEKLSLTALEISVLLVKYFQPYIKTRLKLKWPNDIVNENNEKCAGILIDHLRDNLLVVGLGFNLKPKNPFSLPLGQAFIDYENSSELVKALYNSLLSNRLSPAQVRTSWSDLCSHMQKRVEISHSQEVVRGFFTGINDDGAAEIKVQASKKIFYSGSLRSL